MFQKALKSDITSGPCRLFRSIGRLGQLDRIQLIAIVNLPSVLRWPGRTNLHLNSQCSLALRHARSLACFPVSPRPRFRYSTCRDRLLSPPCPSPLPLPPNRNKPFALLRPSLPNQ